MKIPLLEIRNLSVGYHGKPLLDRLNLSVERGELVALLGANGIGKSTLIKSITGRLQPIEGEVVVDGKNLTDISNKELAKLISIVTTNRSMAGALTVAETVALGRQPYTGFFGRLSGSDKEIVAGALQSVGMSMFATRSVAALSDGERQKVMVARALAQQTPIMLLDEPTSFLDVASRLETFQLLSQLSHSTRKGVIVSTHDIATALRLADRLWLLAEDARGERTVVAGTPSELIENGALETMFRGRHVRFDTEAGDFIPTSDS